MFELMKHGYSPQNKLFLYGASALNEKIFESGKNERFFFVDFRLENIAGLRPCKLLKHINDTKVVLIAHDRLLPLAIYYLTHEINFIAVFSSRTSFDVIVDSLTSWHDGEKILRVRDSNFVQLTKNEMDALSFFDGYDVCSKGASHAALRATRPKITYALTRSLAKKMKKKRIYDVIS